MSDLLQGEVWAIMPERLPSIRARLAAVPSPEAIAAVSDAPGATARVAGGVAVIPLHGAIMPRASALDEFFGVTGLDRFGAYLNAALANDQVGTILLDVDSPGGSVGMVAETWAKIMEARASGKKIVAQVSGLCASAAYWLASAADEIICTPSGEVGSIGVIMVHTDISGAAEQAGMRFTVLTAGKFKGEGHPFGPLDESATAAIQARLDEFYGMFTGAVAKGRGVSASAVRSGYGEGRVLSATAAKAAGMIDRIASMDDTLARLTARKGNTRMRAASPALELAAFSFTPTLTAPLTACNWTATIGQTFTASLAAPVPVVPAASGGEPAAVVVPLPESAPKAKEFVMPDETAGAAEIAALTAKVQRMEGFAALRKNYPELAAKVTEWEAADQSLAQAEANARIELRALLTASPAPKGAPAPRIEVGLPNESKRPWNGAGDFYASVITAYSPGGTVDPRLFAAATGMSQGVPSDGGFAVLPEFSNQIYEGLTSDPNALLPMTDNYTVTGESITFPANAETSRATGSRFGGVRGYWISEAGQITSSAPKLRQVKIEPQQMAVLVYLTEKLMRNNGVGLEQYVNRAASEELTFLAGDAIVNGTGVGQPKGIMASGCVVSVAKEASQPAATFYKANANKMWARMHPRSRANAVWLMNVDVEPQLDDFNTLVKNVAGTENVGGIPTQIYNAEKNTLKGRPIVFAEFCQTLGTVGDVILADMKGYVTGTRGGVDQAVSMHLRFDYAEQALRFMYELDGQTWLNSAITPFKGSNTLSSFVTCATR